MSSVWMLATRNFLLWQDILKDTNQSSGIFFFFLVYPANGSFIGQMITAGRYAKEKAEKEENTSQ